MMFIVIQIDGKMIKLMIMLFIVLLVTTSLPPQWPTTRIMRGAWENGHDVLNE